MNIAGSLVESYMYADMYNREYDGGAGVQDKIQIGGMPIEHIFEKNAMNGVSHANEQEGGKPKHSGPLSNKVVPAGLVLIQIRKEPDVKYEDHFCPGTNREVISDKLYDSLMSSVLVEKRRNRTPPKRKLKNTKSMKNSK